MEGFRSIGLVVAFLTVLAFVILWYRNIRQSRAELGAEVEVAPNRRPYLADEELEGPKLDRSLGFALVILAITAVGLPLYWLAEPGRQDGAVEVFESAFVNRGENLYTEGAQCAGCHVAGGVGGSAPYVLQDADGQYITTATWYAPSLDTVLQRYSEDEVRYVLNYGRPTSPMAAWGTPGGGPLTEQQVENIIEYLETIQLPTLDDIAISESADPEAAAAAAAELEEEIRAEVERSLADGEFETLGEAVFNLGFFSGFKGGGLSCARCHTSAWSLGPETAAEALEEGVAGCGGGNPSGIGYNLCDGQTIRRFPDDSFKLPDGSWYPEEGLFNDDGEPIILAQDGTEIPLDERGTPVNEEGEPLAIQQDGSLLDIASCRFVSGLNAEGEPIDPDDDPEDPDTEVLEPTDDMTELSEGRLVAGCDDPISMPERTSEAHLDFVYNGAEAGTGYGLGGQSFAGMMPGFGGVLPLDYIQAVIDYERSL